MFLVGLGSLLLAHGAGLVSEPPAAAAPPPPRLSMASFPISFVENRGQTDPHVRFYTPGRHSVAFTPSGVTFVVHEAKRSPSEAEESPAGTGSARRTARVGTAEAAGWAVQLTFPGARAGVVPEAGDETETRISYFHGSQADWKAGMRTYSTVVYRNLWAGVDLVYRGEKGRLKQEFVVAPGVDPGVVRVAYAGLTGLRVDPQGDLHLETPRGELVDERPYTYQEVEGRRLATASEFVVGPDHTVRYRIGEYDRSRPLVIDPALLVYCGYIGGNNIDSPRGIAADGTGSVYITGMAASPRTTFPVKEGPDLTENGTDDAFVAKVNAAGTALVYCGYIGGNGIEQGLGIAVDGDGNAYVTGETASEHTTFPATASLDPTHNGGLDAFVAKVNPAGTALVYCAYVGGSGHDGGAGIALDGTRNAYVTGYTGSSQASFPLVGGPDLTQNGSNDAFVAKVNPAGSALIYCGYIGGSGNDNGNGIAVDGNGSAYVTGYSPSTEATFPGV